MPDLLMRYLVFLGTLLSSIVIPLAFSDAFAFRFLLGKEVVEFIQCLPTTCAPARCSRIVDGLYAIDSAPTALLVHSQLPYVTYDNLLNFTLSTSELYEAQSEYIEKYRGTCPRGMTPVTSSLTNIACEQAEHSPSALLPDALNLTSLQSPVSQLSCGGWMASSGFAPGTSYTFQSASYMRYKEEERWNLVQDRVRSQHGTYRRVSAAVEQCVKVRGDPPLAILDAKLAYQHLLAEVNPHGSAFRAAGVLLSYGCPAFLTASLRSYGKSIAESIDITNYQNLPSPEDLYNASIRLGSVGAAAAAAAVAMEDYLTANSTCTRTLQLFEFETMAHGLIEGVDSLWMPIGTPSSSYLGNLQSLSALGCLEKRVTTSLVEGLCAYCVDNARRLVQESSTFDVTRSLDSRRPRGAEARPNTIGTVDIDDISPSDISKATRLVGTLGRRSAFSAFSASRLDHRRYASESTPTGTLSTVDTAVDVCVQLLRDVSPTMMDAELYEAMVPPGLSLRLEDQVASIREATANAVMSAPFTSVFLEPQIVADKIRTASFRIAGASSHSWAGPSVSHHYENMHDIDRDVFASRGFATRLLELSRAESRDILRLANPRTDPCDAPPLFDASSMNAYYYTEQNCVVILLGLMDNPFVKSRYDDFSIMSRLGFVIAHEFGHAALHSSRWLSVYDDLLQPYVSSTREEGLADVIAMQSLTTLLANLTRTSRQEAYALLCLHFGQVWCAIPYPNGYDVGTPTHPPGSYRVDWLDKVMKTRVLV